MENANNIDSRNVPSNKPTIKKPSRFIYTEADMGHFRQSPARRELLSFVSAMGRSCTSKKNHYHYNHQKPLIGLSPGLASLHGSLRAMESWLDDIPPDKDARARFGNPSFRKWHDRLMKRSQAIVISIVDCSSSNYGTAADDGLVSDDGGNYLPSVLDVCSEKGYRAATQDADTSKPNGENDVVDADDDAIERESIVTELSAYLCSSFGHPTRLDYGTGHESSFIVLLCSLLKIGCFGTNASSHERLGAVALSIMSQYLRVTRGLQSDYMLEPAGSHGVWGLDDYHCLPFYFGACQLIGNDEDLLPQSIHNDDILRDKAEEYMYFGCIGYIKSLKKGVPFFESSPMLNDISMLDSWLKVSKGLLKLYEGEVLEKLPVVQHFVFGEIFKATWTPSQKPRTAPTRSFINGPNGDECIAPWAAERAGLPPPTRAPWAK